MSAAYNPVRYEGTCMVLTDGTWAGMVWANVASWMPVSKGQESIITSGMLHKSFFLFMTGK